MLVSCHPDNAPNMTLLTEIQPQHFSSQLLSFQRQFAPEILPLELLHFWYRASELYLPSSVKKKKKKSFRIINYLIYLYEKFNVYRSS